MKREERYIVLKLNDLASCLSADEKQQLDAIRKKVSEHRLLNGKRILECAVVESDWPEFERTWKMISDRVDMELNTN